MDDGEKRSAVPALPVWRRGIRAVPAARLPQGRRLHRRRAGPADRRHPVHRLRLQPLPQDRAAGRRGGGEAACGWPAGCRSSSRPSRCTRRSSFPTSMLLRNLMAMDVEEMVAGAAARRRGADRRLRQDHPRRADGRDQRRHAGDRRQRRLDAGRPPRGHPARRLHRLPPPVGRLPRRLARRAGARPRARPAHADVRHLHGDGHRLDHGLHGRDAGLHAAGHRHRAGGVVRPRALLGSGRHARR